MSSLYTKDGVPLTVQGNAVFNPDGENVGNLQGDRVYDLQGGYRGTVVNGRLIYRSTDSAAVGSARATVAGAASASAHAAGSAEWGDEPNIEP
jgi:hypothetical protein